MGSRMVRCENGGLADPLDGEIVASQLMGDDAEMVPRVGMVGLHGKDLTVKRLGVRQSPGLMVPEGLFKDLCNGQRAHDGLVAHHCCHRVR